MFPEVGPRPRWTRREMLWSLAGCQLQPASGKGQWFASDRLRILDAATDFPMLRLTAPAYSSRLPASHLRAVSHARSFLLFSSDRGGSPQVFRLELGTGRQQQLTEAAALDVSSPALLPNDRSLCYLAGPSLRRLDLTKLKEKEVYRVPEGWSRGEGFSISRDGSQAALVEVRGASHRLRLVKIPSGRAATVVEGARPLSHPLVRSRREGILYREGADALWVVGCDGRNRRRLPAVPGGLRSFFWAPDGRSVVYLHHPPGRPASALRECRLDTATDQLVAETSLFETFSANADASVFVGASANRGAPYILLLLRSTRREMVLCEHRASDPARAEPVFSPDSQWVFLQSDREGKWVLYSVPVDRLVERTQA